MSDGRVTTVERDPSCNFSIFLTVGTTKFEKLVETVTSKPFLDELISIAVLSTDSTKLKSKGYPSRETCLTVQIGKGENVPQGDAVKAVLEGVLSERNFSFEYESNTNANCAFTGYSSISEKEDGTGSCSVNFTDGASKAKHHLTVRWYE